MAAIYVVIHHCRWLLTENYSFRTLKTFNLENITTKLLIPFRFGHEAVIFFFVLSGYVIHYSTTKYRNSFNFTGYFKKRVNRIFPPLLFALIITFLLDYFGKDILKLSTYVEGSKYFGLVVDNLNWQTFLANFISLQELNLNINHFGSNVALWSLSYEWWFYLMYPLFYKIHLKSKYIAIAIQITLFIIFAILIKEPIPIFTAIFSKMIIWWFGVLLAELYINSSSLIQYLGFLVLCIPIAILFFYNNRIFGDLLWGIGFVGLISYLLSLKENSKIIILLNKLKSSGSYSFTLYLTHVPIIFLFHSILIYYNNGKLPNSYIYVFVAAAICIFFAKIVSQYIEKLVLFKNSKN